jgi:hypothetical protein
VRPVSRCSMRAASSVMCRSKPFSYIAKNDIYGSKISQSLRCAGHVTDFTTLITVRRRGDQAALGGAVLITGGRPQWMARPVHAHGRAVPRHRRLPSGVDTPPLSGCGGESQSLAASSLRAPAEAAQTAEKVTEEKSDGRSSRARKWHGSVC